MEHRQALRGHRSAHIARVRLDDAEGQALAGKTITFAGMAESAGITGSGVTDITFSSPEGRPLVYRVNRPLSSLLEGESLAVPFTIQSDMAAEADMAMRGLRVYTLTGVWRDNLDNPVKGLKFVPVTIDSVSTGNALFPCGSRSPTPTATAGAYSSIPGPRTVPPHVRLGLLVCRPAQTLSHDL